MSIDTGIYIGVTVLVLLFTFNKKRKEVGKEWDGPLRATVTIKDKNLKCYHCGHDKFGKREGLLNTTWVTFFRFAFWNESARCFVCKNCGFTHWFLCRVEKAEIERNYD